MPLVVILVSLPVAILVAIIWPWLQLGLLSFGQTIIPEKVDNSTRHLQWGIASVYTMINRALNASGLMRVFNIYFFDNTLLLLQRMEQLLMVIFLHFLVMI